MLLCTKSDLFLLQLRSVPSKEVLPKVEQLLVVGRADEEVAVLEVERAILLGGNAGAESGLGVGGSLEMSRRKLALATVGRVADLAGDVPLQDERISTDERMQRGRE
jgi:hypothetical protein